MSWFLSRLSADAKLEDEWIGEMSDALHGLTEYDVLTKDHRWNIKIAKYRVDKAHLLRLRPNNV